ncbi:MAG TPA: aspartyl protease family protein [Pyrinomonadaceae bacterium]|nr:aspartyl protease family protein [Pyrinomonadaceae bacterium]
MKAVYQPVFVRTGRFGSTLLVTAALLIPILSAGALRAQGVSSTREVKQILKSADKLIAKGDLLEAERVLRESAAENPKDSNIKLKLAFTLLKMRGFGEAYELSYAIAKEEPKNSYAFAVLGSVLLAAGRFNDSRMILSRALTLNSDENLALASYGLLEFYENRLSRSLDFLAEAVFRSPENPDYLFSFAQVAARSEKFQEAANAYKKFLLVSKNTDDDRRARIKGLVVFLEYLGHQSSLYVIGGSNKSTVDLELAGNRPVVQLKVNGRPEPLRFVLDTGSGISVISNQTAKRLKIKPVARGGFAKGIGGNGRFEIVYGFVREIEIGLTRIKNVPVYIREFHQNAHNIDGYIGISLISKFLTTVDYGDKKFSLIRNSADQPVEVDSSSGNITLPLRLTSSGFLSGEVQMDGVDDPMNFIVDTGASVSVVSHTIARREPISSLPRKDVLRVVGAAGVTENVESFTLPRIKFGDHSRDSITAIALDLNMINDASGFEQSGILGGNFFLNYRMTFDFKNSRLMFTPVRSDN